jgi:adenosylhomocysteine nucleosidase
MRILVTFAVEAEFAPWRSRRKFIRQEASGLDVWNSSIGDGQVFVVLTGIGDHSASVMDLMTRVANIGERFDYCISSGLAGALRGHYELGEIVVAKLLKSARVHKDIGRDGLQSDKQLVELAVSHGATLADAFCTAATVLTTAEQKSGLALNADVVEMESFDVAKEACAWGARVVAIRSISDRAGDDLPIDFNRTISSDRRVSIPRVLAEVAKNPVSLGPLIRFGKQSRGAAEALAQFLEEYVNSLAHLVVTPAPVKVVAR